jgi:hypothetical protein
MSFYLLCPMIPIDLSALIAAEPDGGRALIKATYRTRLTLPRNPRNAGQVVRQIT